MNFLVRFCTALTLSSLIVVVAPIYLGTRADPFRTSPRILHPVLLSHLETQLGPQPPCGKEPIPPYPGLDGPAVVKSWSKSDFGRDWKPPSCTAWADVGFTTLVTIAAHFQYPSGAQGLLRHIGAISELGGMRYWSTTYKKWRTLIVNAYALTDSEQGQYREDFTPDEIRTGKTLYFEQVDKNMTDRTRSGCIKASILTG